MASLSTIKNWFLSGLHPTQTQFWATWDSFFHKDGQIPQASIEDLQQSFDDKADVDSFHAVAISGDYNDLENTPNNAAAEWQTIEGSDVKKGNGNVNNALLESGDTVRFKPLTNSGFPLLVLYGVYDEALDLANKQSEKSYVIPTYLT